MFHFFGRFIRERDGTDILGRNVVMLDEVGDPGSKHSGLA